MMKKYTVAALLAASNAAAAYGGPDGAECEMEKAMANESYKGERAAWGDLAAKTAYSVD